MVVALGKALRRAAMMSGRLSLISESVPRYLLGTGVVVFARVVLGVFLFPFRIEELAVEVVAGQGLV